MADTIALVGGETLLGKEVRDVLGETALGQQLRLVASAEEETGTLTEVGGSPAFLAKLDPDAVEDAAVVILAGSAESSKAALDAHPSGLIIDLTYAAEHDPSARVRAPQAEGADYEVDHTGLGACGPPGGNRDCDGAEAAARELPDFPQRSAYF